MKDQGRESSMSSRSLAHLDECKPQISGTIHATQQAKQSERFWADFGVLRRRTKTVKQSEILDPNGNHETSDLKVHPRPPVEGSMAVPVNLSRQGDPADIRPSSPISVPEMLVCNIRCNRTARQSLVGPRLPCGTTRWYISKLYCCAFQSRPLTKQPV